MLSFYHKESFMFSRKEQDVKANHFPSSWTESITTLLSNVYLQKKELSSKDFKVLGLIYPDELTLVVSLYNKDILHETPTTFIASSDLNDRDPKKLMSSLVNSIGIFFDNVFSKTDWSDYSPNWQIAQLKDVEFYYKISRENVMLTLEAEEILNKAAST
jgi:hypothetical protein